MAPLAVRLLALALPLLAVTLASPPATAASPPDAPTMVPPAATAEPVADPAADARALRMVAAVSVVHGAFALWTYAIWYRGLTPAESFGFRDEGFFGTDTYAGGADKAGHALGSYALTRASAQLLGAAGVRPLPRLLLANLLTFGSYLAIELKDGWHHRFGFSWQDIVANATGNLLATAMELSPSLDAIFDLRLHWWPSDAYLQRLAGDETNVAEDYTAMRFELVLKGAAFVPPPRQTPPALHTLRYLQVGVGFAALGYKPVRTAWAQQQLTLVLGLDVQTLLDDLIYDRSPGLGRQSLRLLTEIVAVPQSSVPAVVLARRRAPALSSP